MIEKKYFKESIIKEFQEVIKNKFGYELTYTVKEMKDDYLNILDEHIDEEEDIINEENEELEDNINVIDIDYIKHKNKNKNKNEISFL